jgi:hypothetical protein
VHPPSYQAFPEQEIALDDVAACSAGQKLIVKHAD